MIRIIVRTDEASMAANVGGAVESTWKTFDVVLPELEAFLQKPKAEKWPYSHRQVSGVEVLDAVNSHEELLAAAKAVVGLSLWDEDGGDVRIAKAYAVLNEAIAKAETP